MRWTRRVRSPGSGSSRYVVLMVLPSSRTARTRVRPGSTASTVKPRPSSLRGMTSSTRRAWRAGTTTSELGTPLLSSVSWLYQPARVNAPIWTSHGHTCSGAASIVTARVASNQGRGTMSSPGIGRDTSSAVAPQCSCQGRQTRAYRRATPASPTTEPSARRVPPTGVTSSRPRHSVPLSAATHQSSRAPFRVTACNREW